MVGLALHHVVADRLGVQPGVLFSEVAGRLPAGPVADCIRHFGGRLDVTLSAFGWRLVETEDGPDFSPA